MKNIFSKKSCDQISSIAKPKIHIHTPIMMSVCDCLTQLVVASECRGCLTKVQNMKIHDLNFSEHQKKLKSVQ